MLGRAHGWHLVVDERVNLDQFPALGGQSLLSGTALESSNSNVLILHPHLMTWSQPSPTNILVPLPPSARLPDYSPTDVNA